MRFRCVAAGLLALLASGCAADNKQPPARSRGYTSLGGSSATTGTGPLLPSGPGATTNPLAGSGAGTGTTGVRTPVLNDPNVCASADVAATRIIPTVYLVLDGSSSMNARFGDGTRWSVMREALVGSNGVITRLESVVEFGMSIYSSLDPMNCPTLTQVAPKIGNLMPLQGAFPMAEPGGGTPTGEALQKLVDSLPAYDALDNTLPPPIIILATDGEPNGCSSPATCDWVDWVNCLGQLASQLATAPATYDTTLAAVRAARTKNIPVWVISLADGLNSIPQLQTTANIGAGLADNASPGATIYSPQNPDELTQTLTKLIGQVVSCDVELAGMLDVNRACEGVVTVNGKPLDCNSDQGWKPVDSAHIALQGAACENFKSDPNVLLSAKFPCDVVILQ